MNESHPQVFGVTRGLHSPGRRYPMVASAVGFGTRPLFLRNSCSAPSITKKKAVRMPSEGVTSSHL